MKINLRWLIQAAAFVGCIFFFIRIWELSKQVLLRGANGNLLLAGIYAFLFLVCFFIMAVTSYLKQRNNGTLRNPIPLFEKLISKLRLAP